MPKLASGKFLTKVEREVVVWPAPDANGDGEPVWIPELDGMGRQVGAMQARDKNGAEIRSYFPPEGFKDRPSFDHTSNYVKVDRFGAVVRQPNGEAICIKPGQAIVFNPDGSTEVLSDEWAQYVFAQAHDAVDAPVLDTDDTDDDVSEETEEDRLRARLAELEAAKQ